MKKFEIFLMVMAIIMLLSVGTVSAAGYKLAKVDDTKDVSDYLKIDLNPDYGAIKISKSFLWIETDKLAEYSLTHNTEQRG
jgi:hypothetical protein